jgi:DNA-directed RNA polymerase subunit RPC12/RpoP
MSTHVVRDVPYSPYRCWDCGAELKLEEVMAGPQAG